MTTVYDCPKCEGWGWIATDGDRARPRDCDNCDGLGLVRGKTEKTLSITAAACAVVPRGAVA